MEELQDAIEDAQYVNAISSVEDGPRPVIAWEIPSEEALAEWKDSVTKKIAEEGNGLEAFGLEWTLSSPIGMFQFSAFLKDSCRDYVRINFIEEVCRWRKLRGRHRDSRAWKIVSRYLEAGRVDGEGNPKLLTKTEIEEFDLNRRPIPLSKEQLAEVYEANIDLSCSKCPVGLDGPARDDVIQSVNKYKATRSESTRLSHSGLLSSPESASENLSSRGNGKEKEIFGSGEDGNLATPGENSSFSDKKTVLSPHSTLSRKKSSSFSYFRYLDVVSVLPDDLFDIVESVVLESLRKQYWDGFRESPEYSRLLNFLWYQDRKVVEEDFFVMRVLGRGGFGLVTACKKGTSGKLYAMKVMNKKRIKIKKSEKLALNERSVMAAVNSPFVVNLKYSFQSKDDIFLILDLMTGGDLSFHLSQKGKFPKEECLYYAARIMLGLQALHDKGFVYRDLKPENCLLADDGRVKITDLGLATKVTPTLHGAAGTRGYWAPEMLRRDAQGKRMPYGHTVDWFSFGCVLCEFISGTNPFRSETALNFGLGAGEKTKEKAIDHATLKMEPEFDPKYYDEDAADLCCRLLEKDENARLGASGCEDIMSHPWFHALNWEMIICDRVRPPFVPAKDVNAASQSEIGTFAEDKTYHETVLDEKDKEVYKNWDWTNPKAFAEEVIEFLIYERVSGHPLLPIHQSTSCCCVVI